MPGDLKESEKGNSYQRGRGDDYKSGYHDGKVDTEIAFLKRAALWFFGVICAVIAAIWQVFVNGIK